MRAGLYRTGLVRGIQHMGNMLKDQSLKNKFNFIIIITIYVFKIKKIEGSLLVTD